MMNLFYMGGPLFMGILTLLLLAVIIIASLNAIRISNQKEMSGFQLNAVKSVGLFALVFGILGQLIGMYSAFVYIEQVGEVSQAVLAGGLKVSSITTIYGIIIFLIAYLIWLGETIWSNKK